MQKKTVLSSALFLYLFNFLAFSVIAQTKSEDIAINNHYIYINHLSADALDSINMTIAKENKIVVIQKAASQSDFDKICNEFSWIKQLKIAGSNEQINNFSAISNLHALTLFTSFDTRSSKKEPIDLEPLANLSKLSYLDFNATRVKNTDALNKLNQLTNVSFRMSNVSSIAFLNNTPNIQKLSLDGYQHSFKDYSPIANLGKLKELNINSNKYATDEALSALASLSTLQKIITVNNYNITNLNFLQNNVNIEEIDASNCTKLQDLSVLKELRKLKVLDLGKTLLDSIEVLKGITTLTSLDFSNTKIKDISALKHCWDLESINIAGTLVTDISVLSLCEKLKSIDISKTLVQDITPLLKCKKLRSVKLSSRNTSIDEQIEKLQNIYPSIDIRVIN